MQDTDCPSDARSGWSRWIEPQILLLAVLVIGIYFTRLTELPIRGEESRWARVAAQMIEFGDWIIPRQQGQPFLDRPPLAPWAIAAVGLVRGQVDLVAIRLPSVISVLLTTILIYGYSRTFLSRLGAFAAAAAFATAGQVLQIGRLGENEAFYTCVVASSLLLWHWGYARSWPMAVTWIAGYSFAALGTLIKGPQAPAYFIAAAGLFLLIRREWKWIFGWQHVAGVCAFVAVVSLWAVPFRLATDWESTIEIFTRTSAYRYSSHGILEHIATYPFETFVCLLPWSPLLMGLVRPSIRREIGKVPPHVLFLVTAILITYPSVWLAGGARGRYFMPMYPCVAVLIGWMLERAATCDKSSVLRRSWELYLAIMAICIAVGGLVVFGASVFSIESLAPIAQPLSVAVVFAAAALAVSAVLMWARRTTHGYATQFATFALASFLGLMFTGVVVNAWQRVANDMTQVVTQLRADLPAPQSIVSFGPVLT